ncbi:hypothetical protein C5167_005883 [Papaver somniferum]|uniref:Pentacotripeptide-repeat region of PRORP domain-containing protein n=1 Tax=Papaver somniferum TaxID=3469 RepID=A0A4Y7JG17_PAPSO|nr:hypothetical protein C5167_005883 [Papaver somniferum]
MLWKHYQNRRTLQQEEPKSVPGTPWGGVVRTRFVAWFYLAPGQLGYPPKSYQSYILTAKKERESKNGVTGFKNALIHLYASKGASVEAFKVFQETMKPDVVSWSGLVVAYLKAGELDNAQLVFNKMPVKDVVSWTAIISGYSQAKRSKEALELFEQMRQSGVRPDEVTMVSVISACTHLGDLEVGSNVHRYIGENGFGWMVSLCNALIDMYAKSGCVEKARQVFDKMERKTLITWNSMVSACANHGNVEEAIELFHEMTKYGFLPEGVTFLALLTAFTHKGMVEEGVRLFECMKIEYGIEAQIEHYGCMVDMLGRAGRLKEAYELILNMPIPCNDVVLGALLGACRIYGDLDMAEPIVKRLLELKPDEGGYYILLLIFIWLQAEELKQQQ